VDENKRIVIKLDFWIFDLETPVEKWFPRVCTVMHLLLINIFSNCMCSSRHCDNDNEKFYKYVCITTNQPNINVILSLTLTLMLNSTQ